MKTAIMNIIHTVSAFVKAHTVASIVAGAVVVTAAVATPVTVHLINEQNRSEPAPSVESNLSKQDELDSQQLQDEQESFSDEEIGNQSNDDPEENKESDKTNQDKPSDSLSNEKHPPQNNPDKTTNNSTSKNESNKKDSHSIVFKDEGSNVIVQGIGAVPIREAYEKGYIRIKIIDGLAHIVSTLNGVDYVGPADVESGISYDGESPIIYTYADGTTGTEKRDGAKYERLPGMWSTVFLPQDAAGRYHDDICSSCGKKIGDGTENTCSQSSRSQYCRHCGKSIIPFTCHTCLNGSYKENRFYCEDCGRISGNGLNNTCLRYWAVGEHSCVNCGEAVPTNTCHVCKSGCMYCKKTMGNGTNGTCYRDYFSDSKCPSCNVYVAINTCHSCG